MSGFAQSAAPPPPYPGPGPVVSGQSGHAGPPLPIPQPPFHSVYPQVPAQPQSADAANLGARFQALCSRYEIGAEYAQKLRLLSDVDIVVVADDSGSMTTLTQVGDDPFGPMQSRWAELKKALVQIVDIALLFDQNGIDIHFLNRTGMDQQGQRARLVLRNVTQPATIEAAFAEPPAGFTPLARTVKAVFDEKQAVVKEKKLLCLICTDGEPTNESGAVDIEGFRRVLAQRQPIDRIYVNIMACSDDKATLGYLAKLDRTIKNLDVIDDYVSERREVLAGRAATGLYTFGDHIVKTLTGSLDPFMDKKDESNASCCIVL